MKISVLPPISRRIKDPQEYSLRVMVSNEIEDHFPMGGRPKGLRVSEIFFRIICDWNTRLRFDYQLFLGISKICLSLGKLLLDLLELLV